MAKEPYPSETADRYIVRFPDGMRERLKQAAADNNRSMNAEIIARLEASLEPSETPQIMTPEIFDRLFGQIKELREDVQQIKHKSDK